MSGDSFDVAPGVRLRLEPPATGAREDGASLPPFEIGPVSGAKVTLRAGWSGAFGVLRVACVSAPARGFAPGVEDLVFGRATQIVRAALPNVTRLDAGPARATPTGFEQRLAGDAALDGSTSSVAARHALAFTEGGASAVVCSVACVAREHAICAAAVDSAAFEGELAPPPPPSFAVRMLFASVEHPALSLTVLVALAFVLAAALLARRPRSSARRLG